MTNVEYGPMLTKDKQNLHSFMYSIHIEVLFCLNKLR